MTDTISVPVTDAPQAPPPPEKPPVSHTLTAQKEVTAQRQERRREDVAKVAIPAKDVRKLTKKRPENDGPVPIDFSDDAEPDGSLTLRKASKAYGKMKHVEVGHKYNEEYLGHQNIGDDYAAEISEYVTQQGRAPSEAKKVKMGLVRHNGEQLNPIPEGWSAKEHMLAEGEERMSPERATEYLKNYRIAAQQAEEQLRAEIKAGIQAEDEARAAEQREIQQRAAAKPQPTPAQIQAQQQAQARQQQARQQAQAAQQWQNELARMSVDEMRNNRDWEIYRQQMSQIPEFMDERRLQETYAKDPQRFAQLQQFAQADQQFKARAQQLREARMVREHQVNQVRTAQQQQRIDQWGEGENQKFQAWLGEALPQYATGEGLKQLREASREYLRSTGLSDSQIAEQWRSGHLKPAAFQQTIALAAAYRLAQEQSKHVQKRGLPPVQKPGVGRPAGADAAQDIARLERQLGEATSTRQQLLIAGKLQKAKRQMRGN